MYMTTLFNPLIRPVGTEPCSWLEDMVTDPQFKTDADIGPAICLFNFKDIYDASQPSYIRKGLDKIATAHTNRTLTSRSFQINGLHKTATIYCIGTADAIARTETALRILHEGTEGYVDAAYNFPALQKDDSHGTIGWLEGTSGTFIFMDESVFKEMCALFGITPAGNQPVPAPATL